VYNHPDDPCPAKRARQHGSGGAFEPLSEHPELVEVVGRWHWDECGHEDLDGSLAEWTSRLREHVGGAAISMTFVALRSDGAPVGSVSIVGQDMPDREESRDLGPWVGGTYVVPEARNRGVGMALMQAAERTAARLGVPRLYLHTSTAKVFYEKLGWDALTDAVYQGDRVTIMARAIPHSPLQKAE
jgi:GNAT superfamily N-acetyltransferase